MLCCLMTTLKQDWRKSAADKSLVVFVARYQGDEHKAVYQA